jgi:hypothetical protein
MTWRRIDQPDCAAPVVHYVANAAAARDLIFPLFKITTIVAMRGQLAAEPMLPVVACPRSRIDSQRLKAATRVG